MSLTAREALFAAEVAAAYPPGIPLGLWGSARHFRDVAFPKRLEKFGAPEFRIAVLRENEGGAWLPLDALLDVARAAGFRGRGRIDVRYGMALVLNPGAIAARLRAYAERVR